jgi:hypothetical protein
MFKRIILEEWHFVVPYICFAMVAGVFLVIVVKALRLKKSEVEHLSHLPLDDDESLVNTTDQDS